MKVMTLNDINPDGLRITIDWDKMELGTSFFVPCLDVDKADGQIRAIGDRLGLTLRTMVRVEDKKLGLRVWRTM